MSMHITAKPGEIAERILLPGDPLRAKYIAETYFEEPECVSELRGAYCFTGKYKGERVSVLGTGMGIPSVLIYTTELCTEYGCERLIRTGTAGGYDYSLKLGDIVLSQATCTTSALNDHIFKGHFAPIADFSLLRSAYDIALEKNMRVFVGNTICNDHLYTDERGYDPRVWADYGVIAAEMEAAALYTVAARYRKKALTIMTVVVDAAAELGSREDMKDESLQISTDERQNGLDDMIILGLETLIS
ncbi:MAG: purine-nucleoside phosphorylase [Oscillospiraceae bacterium]|nr:purine-nucleoside phosphorylase [Oscillospiraceae bacterium]